ncbi:MAG: isoprenyl transferase [Candidatus Paceibacterota bacterium]
MNYKDGIPHHIAIIMDGNRRWAKKRGLPASFGHRKGYENFKKNAEACYKMGVKILTIYAFSTENWKRSKTEVSFLMGLFEKVLKNELNFFRDKKIKFNAIGQIERLPNNLRKLISEAMNDTKNNKGGVLNLAVSYGGRAEILDAVGKIAKEKKAPNKMNEKYFEEHLYTAGQPDPDLLIRTGGEMRLSGFLPWQSVYSELYFSEKMWPDFSEKDLMSAIKEFQNRKRRFGK